ncbi:hypothetical protein ACOMDP_14325 [Pantoea dispersa]|uniref:hypothetical protein n=1 Tax=Pantoea dispersa TaxID=59814 RepID=UPI003B76B431
MVAGSNPAGATKFSDENHAVKPPFEVAFLFAIFAIGSKMAAGFSIHPPVGVKLSQHPDFFNSLRKSIMRSDFYYGMDI